MATVGRDFEIRNFIESLLAQVNRDFELIIVDQNDDDRLLDIINWAVGQRIEIVHVRSTPPNLSVARNVGINIARGAIIGFPDDDCWYEPDTVDKLLKIFSTVPHVDGVIANWVEQSAYGLTSDHQDELNLSRWRKFRGGDASSICLFFSKPVLIRTGGFNPRLGVGQWFGSGEESDLVLRVLNNGFRLFRHSTVRVHHAFNPISQSDWRVLVRRARMRSRGTGALYSIHKISGYVILRGLIAPIILPLIHRRGFSSWIEGLTMALGRLEGYISWNRRI